MHLTFILLQRYDDLTTGQYVLIIGFVGLILFFIFREIMVWYLKINTMLDNQEKQIKLLEKIATPPTTHSTEGSSITEES
jgi:hypothetical protein